MPRHVNAWSVVESAEDFVGYLTLLSRDAERAREAGAPWHNDSVPAYLAALAALVQPQHYCIDFVEGFGAPPMDSWRDLAAQLHAARSFEKSMELEQFQPVPDGDHVADVETFLGHLRWLIDDFHADQAERAGRAAAGLWAYEGRWAHAIIEDWLGTWGAWLDDWYLKAASPTVRAERAALLEPVSWRSVAWQLSAARIYE
jgi:hypothetical protein